MPEIVLTARHLCDFELIANGGFAPLDGFLNRRDYESVLESMRLSDGTLWPMPVMLDVGEEFVQSLIVGQVVEFRPGRCFAGQVDRSGHLAARP